MLLFLNDIAGSEVLLILVFILMFFGAKSIPGIARSMGSTIRQIKDASSELQNEIKKSGAEMKQGLNLEGLIRETAEDIQRPLDQYAEEIEHAVKFQPPKNSQIPSTVEPAAMDSQSDEVEATNENPISEKENKSETQD